MLEALDARGSLVSEARWMLAREVAEMARLPVRGASATLDALVHDGLVEYRETTPAPSPRSDRGPRKYRLVAQDS